MSIQLSSAFWSLAALAAGAVIGLAFGTIQNIAFRRNQKLQEKGRINSGWAVMPGSMRRVAWLMIALLVVQISCPIFFRDHTQWWVSAGVVFGYGAILFRRLREKKAQLT
jgi:hypothetical protein